MDFHCYVFDKQVVSKRLSEIGAVLDEAEHPLLGEHQVFRRSMHSAKIVAVSIRREQLSLGGETLLPAPGMPNALLLKPVAGSRGKLAEAIRQTLGKRVTNPEALNPTAEVNTLVHAVAGGERILVANPFGHEHNRMHRASFTEKQAEAYRELAAGKKT